MGQNTQFTSAGDTMGATVVITHRVRDGRQGDYEKWITKSARFAGHRLAILTGRSSGRLQASPSTYSVIIRFDTKAHLRAWTESPVRSQLIERVKPLLASGDDFFIRSGLDFWFAPTEAKTKVPARWRQILAFP